MVVPHFNGASSNNILECAGALMIIPHASSAARKPHLDGLEFCSFLPEGVLQAGHTGLCREQEPRAVGRWGGCQRGSSTRE